MVRYGVTVQRLIDSSAHDVYDVLRDYRYNQFILPSHFFEDVKIIKGYGIGEGTRIQKVYRIPILNRRYKMILDVTEPKPGRIIQEIDTNAYNIIQFIVDPITQPQQTTTKGYSSKRQLQQRGIHQHYNECDGTIMVDTTSSGHTDPESIPTKHQCLVTIDVRMFNSMGYLGIFEMALQKYVCYRMYTDALEELHSYMANGSSSSPMEEHNNSIQQHITSFMEP